MLPLEKNPMLQIPLPVGTSEKPCGSSGISQVGIYQ